MLRNTNSEAFTSGIIIAEENDMCETYVNITTESTTTLSLMVASDYVVVFILNYPSSIPLYNQVYLSVISFLTKSSK